MDAIETNEGLAYPPGSDYGTPADSDSGGDEKVSDWLDLLIEAFPGAESSLALDISMSSGPEHVRLRIRGGRLELADARGKGNPDLSIRFHDFIVKEVLLGKAPTCDVFRDAEIAVRDHWRPAAPAAECELAADSAPPCGLEDPEGFGMVIRLATASRPKPRPNRPTTVRERTLRRPLSTSEPVDPKARQRYVPLRRPSAVGDMGGAGLEPAASCL
jgi:hypothetical protein